MVVRVRRCVRNDQYRLMAILCHAESLREVIAFPKTATGNELMTGAPSEPGLDELKEYHISVAAAPPS